MAADRLDAVRARLDAEVAERADAVAPPPMEDIPAEAYAGEPAAQAPGRGRPSIASQLVALVREHAGELCHDGDGTTYVRYGRTSTVETWPLESRAVREWMSHLYYIAHGTAPRSQALADAIATLSGMARYDGPQREVYLRSAATADTVVHDLCDADWRAVTITPEGWSVGAPPVIFRRPVAARALAEPVRGAAIGDVIDWLDLDARAARHVIVWVVAAIIGDAPVPVLELSGPAGAGKSTLLRRIRSVIDPHDADARAAPRSVEDLYVAAHHSYVVAADNVSHISTEMSDALCVLCTGGGYARRTLYTTDDETVLRARRPIIITGVTPVITASDLLDRTIAITLGVRADLARASEADLVRAWMQRLPSVMGAIYDLVAAVLRERPGVRVSALPRMADYAIIGETISRVCGWPSYVAEYEAHRRDIAARGVESSPVASALIEYMRAHESYRGPIGGLSGELVHWRTDSDAWPRSARGVADAIRRAAPGLMSAGLTIEWDPTRRRDGYHVVIRRGPEWQS